MIWKKYWINAISKLPNAFGKKTDEELEVLPRTVNYNVTGESNPELIYVRSDLLDEQLQALQYEVDLLRTTINELYTIIKYYESYNITFNNWGLKDGESRADIIKKFLGQSKPL